MTGYENHAGFTISGSKLQVVEINNHEDQFYLENVDEAYFNETLNFEKDKETKISALLQGAFNEIILRKPLRANSISFTLPFELFHTAQLPFDNTLLHQDLIEEFRWELSVLYPFVSTKNMVIQYIEIEKNEIIPYNSALVIGLQRKYLQVLNNFCVQNKLKLKFVDNIHFAAEKALELNSPAATAGLVLSVYIFNKYLSIIFSHNGKPVHFSTIPLNDASEIPGHIVQAITPKENFNIKKEKIASAFITGDGLSNSVVQTLSDTLDIDFIQFNPFEKLKAQPKLLDNKFYSEQFNSFAPAAGIAYRIA
ncbi:MAG: hypothetical protein WB996_03900 [Ignavibacteriaceae bacterium]